MSFTAIAKKFIKYLAIGFGCLVALGIIGVVFLSLKTSSNKAQNEFKPFAATLNSLGAKKYCENGDGGHSLDNNSPWYDAYYSVPESASLQSQITTTASRAGYDLKPDTQTNSDLNGLTGYKNSTYLVAHNGGKELTVHIAHKGDILSLYCGVKNYGKVVTATSTQALIEFDFTLPDNQ